MGRSAVLPQRLARRWRKHPLFANRTIFIETIMMGMRLTKEGIDRARFRRRFGSDILELFPEPVERMCTAGLLNVSPERISLSKRGRLLSNGVIRAFVDEINAMSWSSTCCSAEMLREAVHSIAMRSCVLSSRINSSTARKESLAACKNGPARPATSAPSARHLAISIPSRKPPLAMIGKSGADRRAYRIASAVGMPQSAKLRATLGVK